MSTVPIMERVQWALNSLTKVSSNLLICSHKVASNENDITSLDLCIESAKILLVQIINMRNEAFVGKLVDRRKDDIGDYIPLDEFQESVKYYGFTDYDGWGYFATETQVCHEVAFKPSETYHGLYKYPSWCTHILWVNK